MQKFFKAGVQNQCDKETLDQIINSIQFLVHGIVQLHELDKKENKDPELEILVHEIDTSKVQQLVEMGFSQSDAVDALLLHISVPEAAEYLILMAGTSRLPSTVLRAVTSANVSETTVPSTSLSALSAETATSDSTSIQTGAEIRVNEEVFF